jgi:hypothetical protein
LHRKWRIVVAVEKKKKRKNKKFKTFIFLDDDAGRMHAIWAL